MALWCSGYQYCTTSFNKAWTQVLCRLKSCSQRVEDSHSEDLWQWSRLEIRLSAFRWSAIPQKQFIIIIIIIIIIIAAIDSNQVAEILKYYESVKNKLFWMAKAIQSSIYQLWQKSFRILIVTILLILWSYPIDPCFVYFVEFILYLERGSILDA